MSDENDQKARRGSRKQLGIVILPEMEQILNLHFGHGDKRVIVHAALLMFHCAAPILQMAFRSLYRDVSEGRITLDEAKEVYKLLAPKGILDRISG